jgi:hypothetical protein
VVLLQGGNVSQAEYSGYATAVARYGFVVAMPERRRTLVISGFFPDSISLGAADRWAGAGGEFPQSQPCVLARQPILLDLLLCQAPTSADHPGVRRLTRRYTTAWLERVLRGDATMGTQLIGAPIQADVTSGDITFQRKEPTDSVTISRGSSHSNEGRGVPQERVCVKRLQRCWCGVWQCDDGRFCNGVERCAPDDPLASVQGCLRGDFPCELRQVCNEATNACTGPCSTDADGDGEVSAACGGTDCDDRDAQRYSQATEVCDAANLDEDCDNATYGERDDDSDGDVDARCCNGDRCGLDCDDSKAGVNRGSPEVCNGIDDNCNAMTDEGLTQALYPDADFDG